MMDQELLQYIRSQYTLSLDGIHGWAHWLRVRENGLRLAQGTDANPAVVELFSFLHDARRENDGRDPEHGPRAAEMVQRLQGHHIFLSAADLDLLAYACRYHTLGWTEADITVQVCWDADRLDLGRIGIRPAADRLCTPAAQDPAVIAWAWQRSQGSPAEPGLRCPGRHDILCADSVGR